MTITRERLIKLLQEQKPGSRYLPVFITNDSGDILHIEKVYVDEDGDILIHVEER